MESKRKSWVAGLGLVAGPLLSILAVWSLPNEFAATDGTTQELGFAGRATVGMAVWMAIWWLTETVDITVTALLPLVVFPLVGIAGMDEAAAPYADPIIFLFLGGFLLAQAMEQWGLGERIAIGILSFVGSRPIMILGAFMLVTALFSAFVSNTATTAMMLPIGLNVIHLVKKQLAVSNRLDESRPFSSALMLAIAYAASIGGMATIIGSPPNAIMAAAMKEFQSSGMSAIPMRPIDFVAWARIGVPVVAIVLSVAWIVLAKFAFRLRNEPIEGAQESIQDELRRLGQIRFAELVILATFVSAVVLWLTRPWLTQWEWRVGFGESVVRPFAGLSDTVIAMGAGVALFLLPSGRNGRRVLEWSSTANVPWGTLLLFGGGLSLASAIEANHVAEFLGAQAGRIEGVPGLLVVVAIVAGIVFLGELTSNTATAAIAIPILAAIAPGLGLHPYQLVFPATLACSCGFMLPVATPPNALVFGSGHITMREMIRTGFWLDLICVVLVSAISFSLVSGTLV